MNVSVVDVSPNQKKLQVEIPAQKVKEQIESRYRDLAKRVQIKGFRPGKVPRSIIKSYYGKSIEQEVSSQLIQETFPEALRESDLKPLVEADVDDIKFEDSGALSYVALVDVAPDFEIGEYKQLEIQRKPVEVRDADVDAELERIREQHTQLRTLETDRPIQEGDVALIDFVPSIDGHVFEKGKTNDYMLEIGKKTLHPDFDDKLVGHRAGESLSFVLDYPEDAKNPDLAGKNVHFDVTIREVKEKEVPELNDEFAQEVGAQFDTLDALRNEITSQIQKREEDKASRDVRQQIMDKMLENTQFELSQKVIEREIDRLIGLLRYQFESQGLKIDTSAFNSPQIRAEYQPQAEKNIRWGLIARRIAEMENLQLTESEQEEILADVARVTRTDIETVKKDYADSAFVEQSRESKLQDKVMKFLEDEASYTEVSGDEESKNQE